MSKYPKVFVVVLSIAATALFMVGVHAVADEYFEHDDHHEKEKNRSHKKKGRDGSGNAPLGVNSAYLESCGGCHWAYVPALLPAKSWENILATLGDHFGSEVVLTAQQRSDVSKHVLANASDTSTAKIGRKITQSLGGAVPGRVVEVPYIVRKHRKVDQAVFSRKSVKSLSNCVACHPSASSAQFDDDDVRIPSE